MTAVRCDVAVVGARCAGAATAMLLAREGVDVVVVDRVAELGDTMSTHSFTRGGVVQLARWGLLDDLLAAGTPAITNVTFHVDGSAIRREVRDAAGVNLLVAPRRRVLDNLLLRGAADAGAVVHLGTAVDDVRRDGTGRVVGVTGRTPGGARITIDADLVVGADGMGSRVARAVGAPEHERFVTDTGACFTYLDGIPWDGFELHVAERAFAGIFPTNDGAACVWVMAPGDVVDAARAEHGPSEACFHHLMRTQVPALAERVAGARRAERVRLAVRLPSFVREPVGDGWALVGDAGCFRDPITGHGITDALRDAELLASAVTAALGGADGERAAMARYAAEREAALRPVFEVTTALAGWPGTTAFLALQKQLSRLLDDEAEQLAARPPLVAASIAAA